MKLLNCRVMVMLAIVSVAPIARPAQIVGVMGQALIPFCAGVFRGADAYQKGQKVEASVLAIEDATVSSVTTLAAVMKEAPHWLEFSETRKEKLFSVRKGSLISGNVSDNFVIYANSILCGDETSVFQNKLAM